MVVAITIDILKILHEKLTGGLIMGIIKSCVHRRRVEVITENGIILPTSWPISCHALHSLVPVFPFYFIIHWYDSLCLLAFLVSIVLIVTLLLVLCLSVALAFGFFVIDIYFVLGCSVVSISASCYWLLLACACSVYAVGQMMLGSCCQVRMPSLSLPCRCSFIP